MKIKQKRETKEKERKKELETIRKGEKTKVEWKQKIAEKEKGYRNEGKINQKENRIPSKRKEGTWM